MSSGSRALADAVCELLARLEAEAGVVSVSAAGEGARLSDSVVKCVRRWLGWLAGWLAGCLINVWVDGWE